MGAAVINKCRSCQLMAHAVKLVAVLLLASCSWPTAGQDTTQASPLCTAQQLCTCWSTLDPPACYSPAIYHCEDNTRLAAGPEPSGACSVGKTAGSPPAAGEVAEAPSPTTANAAQPSSVCSAQGLCTCYNTQNPPACYKPTLYHCRNTNQLLSGPEPSGKCAISSSSSSTDGAAEPKPSVNQKVLPSAADESTTDVTKPTGLGDSSSKPAAKPAVIPPVTNGAVAEPAAVIPVTNVTVTNVTGVSNQTTISTNNPAGSLNNPMLFNDDFTTLGSTKWGFDIGDGSDYGIPGWGNAEFECYTSDPANAAIIRNPSDPSDGVLRIKSIHSNAPKPCINRNAGPTQKMWTSAKLVTKDLHSFAPTLGPNGCEPVVVEASIKLPLKQGHWSAFWMLPQDMSMGWPKGGELDLMEHVNKELEVLGTVHLGNAEGAHMQAPPNNHVPMTAEALQGFNTYKFLWGCESVSWYVNGKLAYSVQKSDLPNWPFDKPFYIILNLAVGGNLPGFDVDVSGGEMLVDYVRVYKAAT